MLHVLGIEIFSVDANQDEQAIDERGNDFYQIYYMINKMWRKTQQSEDSESRDLSFSITSITDQFHQFVPNNSFTSDFPVSPVSDWGTVKQ